MIRTRLIRSTPIIVYHRIKGRNSEQQVTQVGQQALAMIEQSARSGNVCVALDMRDYEFDIQVHKAWSQAFKLRLQTIPQIHKVAIIADSSEKIFSEQSLMQNAMLHFYTQTKPALCWLLGLS